MTRTRTCKGKYFNQNPLFPPPLRSTEIPLFLPCFFPEYNMLTNTFKYLGSAYKHLLTLSLTQLACERSFSALKFIKANLEGLMLIIPGVMRQYLSCNDRLK